MRGIRDKQGEKGRGDFHREGRLPLLYCPDAERIKEGVCKAFDVDQAELYESRRGLTNETRNVAIYLFRTLRGDSLEEIGREFSMNRCSSVQRMRGNISKNRQLRTRVEKLKAAVYLSQE